LPGKSIFFNLPGKIEILLTRIHDTQISNQIDDAVLKQWLCVICDREILDLGYYDATIRHELVLSGTSNSTTNAVQSKSFTNIKHNL